MSGSAPDDVRRDAVRSAAAPGPAGQIPGEDALEKTLVVHAAPERVFRALTDSDELGLWFAPIASVEPRVGGLVEFVFYNRNGTFSVFQGEITDFVPPSHLGFSWHTPVVEHPPQHIVISLAAEGGDTRLRLVHRGFAGQPVERDVHDEAWEHYLRRLTTLVDGAGRTGG